MREPGHPKLLNNSFDQMKIMAKGNILPSLSGITETGGKIGDVYWIIGLMKIENMVYWTETNEPMDADFPGCQAA